jgi:ATP-dependent Clp protease ATP-binding subunit ClpA
VLLQILDDGRLTDGHGRTVDFKNTIIIMTSNLGTELARAGRIDREELLALLRRSFRPEFLNRIDDIIVFHQLTKEHMRQIIEILLRQLQGRLAQQGISIELTEGAKDLLLEKGFDPYLGARPLKRSVQRLLEDPLSEFILRGELKAPGSVLADREGDEMVFRPAQIPTPVAAGGGS